MDPLRWLDKTHPIVQRELAVWQRYRLAVRLFVAGFGLLCALSLVSDLTTIFAPDAFGYLFLYIQNLPGSLAVFALKAALAAAAAAAAAREFESRAWDELILTGLRPGEILAGKAAAIARLLRAPILIWIGLGVVLTLAFFARQWFEAGGVPDSTPVYLFFLAFDMIAPCVAAALYLALGLLVSTLAGTQAKAVIGALAVFGAFTLAVRIALAYRFSAYRLLIGSTLFGGGATSLIELGGAAGLALLFFKLAEWRAANRFK